MNHLTKILFLALIITSCQSKEYDRVEYAQLADQEMIPITRQSTEAPLEPLENTEINKKKIIKDGRIGIEVIDLEKSKSRIDSIVIKNRGYYANESYNNTDYETSYNLDIRMPSREFENFIIELESGDGRILYKEITARDVTDEFIDLESRLENKKKYLERYQKILKQAISIEEILQVQERIRRLEEEIESTTGRLRYLNDLVAYSTLHLSILKKKQFDPVKRDRFLDKFKQSLSKGWYGFVDFILILFQIWPFWVLIISIFYLWKKIRKRKLKKSSK